MDKLDIFKQGLGFVIGCGVGRIVKGVVDAHVIPDTNWQKVTVFAGKTAIGLAITEVATNSVNREIDEIITFVGSIASRINSASE